MAKLGDICKKASSAMKQSDLEGKEGIYPIYGASGFIKNVNFYVQEKPYVAVVKDGAGIGRVFCLPEKSSVIGTMQYIIPNDDTDVRYLAYAMEYMNLSKYYTGATIPHIYFKDYCNENLKSHSLSEQKKIADRLNRIDRLINCRKQQLAKLDELVKARFVEMFGDPVSNPMSWERKVLSDCLAGIDNGKSFVCANEPRVGSHPAVLKLSAVTYGYYKPYENKALIDESLFVRSAEVHQGDLLFTRKNTPELVGMSAYVSVDEPNLMMPDLIFRLKTKECCNPIFLWMLINHDLFRENIRGLANGSAKSMSNISKERLMNLNIILPSLQVQNQFAAFVQQVDKSKLTVQQSLDKLELLKKKLMQEYFG